MAFDLPSTYVRAITSGYRRKKAGGPITEAHQVNARERKMHLDGVVYSTTKWSQVKGLPLSALKSRLYRGWSEVEAINTPLLLPQVREIVLPPGPSTAYVPLDNDGAHFALIDVESVPLLQTRNWQRVYIRGIGRSYAQATDWNNGQQSFVLMKQLVLGAAHAPVADAINHNNLDCRRCNLRVASKAQSAWRNRKRSNNRSGAVGVSWREDKRRWVARLETNGQRYWLGYHATKEAATATVDRKIAETRGEFGRLSYEEDQNA